MRKLMSFALVGTAAMGLAACDVEQTKEGDMPEVDVDVKEGSLPEYDVDTPDVDVKMEEKTVEVPTVEVDEADAGAPGPN
ncbi:hypothetical protein D2V17_08060 [Aurantiacibacter xanthus]|uniref:Secreted protein n=1 Tax=Aurantiacibacter xanthus TaxID=1784712 RepID=A0A3A1P6L9_9SPHN|nr:hypothetical protein [Aurantiacibacter xanthus]RIV88135.1 hypothetical protein D2V17_08060 [Aurantiacibacter xanthus]